MGPYSFRGREGVFPSEVPLGQEHMAHRLMHQFRRLKGLTETAPLLLRRDRQQLHLGVGVTSPRGFQILPSWSAKGSATLPDSTAWVCAAQARASARAMASYAALIWAGVPSGASRREVDAPEASGGTRWIAW